MSKQHIVKSIFWLTVSEIIYNLSGYIIHSGAGRILGPAEYGRFGLVVTLTTMVIILIGNGIPTAMSKYLSEVFETNPSMVYAVKKQAIILQSIIIGFVTIIFFLLTPLIANLLGDPTLTRLFRISTLIIPAFAAASFYFYYYTGIHKFNIQSILKTARSLMRIIAIIGLAYLFKINGSIAGYIVAPLLVFIIALIIDHFWVSKEFPKNTGEIFDWKKLANYAWPLTLFLLFYELLITMDLYLVKSILRNDYLTGIYNGSLTIGRIPYYLFYALTIVLLPSISKSTSQNKSRETQHIISQSLRLMIMFLISSIIIMFVYAKPIIELFYGAQYSEAVIPMQILVFGVGFLTIFYVMSFVFNGAGKVKIPMYISFFGMILNILLNYLFIKPYGIAGSAIATSITSVVIMFIMLFYIHKHFQGLIKFISFVKMLIAAMFMYFLSFFFLAEGLIFILWCLILFAFYILLLYLFGEIKKEDFNLLKKLIVKK